MGFGYHQQSLNAVDRYTDIMGKPCQEPGFVQIFLLHFGDDRFQFSFTVAQLLNPISLCFLNLALFMDIRQHTRDLITFFFIWKSAAIHPKPPIFSPACPKLILHHERRILLFRRKQPTEFFLYLFYLLRPHKPAPFLFCIRQPISPGNIQQEAKAFIHVHLYQLFGLIKKCSPYHRAQRPMQNSLFPVLHFFILLQLLFEAVFVIANENIYTTYRHHRRQTADVF